MGKKYNRKKSIEFLKSEYDLARHEWEYYTDLFNKQDSLFSIYFAVFAIIVGAIYYIIQVNNKDTLLDNIVLLDNQRLIICCFIIFLAITYMYLFIIMMGNSYYLIIYSEKTIILEKILNYYIKLDVFIWEKHFMSKIQSTENFYTKGFLNVNILKGIFAVLLYCSVEIPLCILWYVVSINNWMFYGYLIVFILISIFLIFNWIIMWYRLPQYYRKELEDLYKKKLNIDFNVIL